MVSTEKTTLQTGAAMGVDIINDTDAHTPPTPSLGWKFLTVSVEAEIHAITDDGDVPSTNLTGVTLSAGTLLAANGLFTSVTLSSGTVVMVRG
jgi:hypothetical protein